MSTFTRDATEVLRAAEHALSGGPRAARGTGLSSYALYQGNARPTPPYGNKENAPQGHGDYHDSFSAETMAEGDARMLEVLRQLQVALSEIGALRSEMTAEKESRSQTLVALGKRWKEELMVELRSGDFQLRRDVAELQYQVGEKLREQATQNALLQRQVEELQRAAKARDATQFDRWEMMREELDALRTKCDAAMAQSGATRVECTAQLERERAALGHRLDTELVRFADMRRDEQKELRVAKEFIKSEVAKVGSTVRELVDNAWHSCAAALEAGAKETNEAVRADIKHTKATVAAMEEKVEHCVRTCQAEARLLGATLTERINALESNEAVTASRVDRAEKKSDAAHDATSRMEASFLAVKEEADRTTAVAQQAAARAQRAEDVLLDRDARLVQVESQLHSAASSEKLRAEIEGCKRATARVESQVEALSRVCERSEALAEKTARSQEAAAERVARCEKLFEKSHDSVKNFVDGQQQWTQRLAAVEDLRDRVMAVTEQQELAAARVEQRLAGGDSKMKFLSERQSQLAKDSQQERAALAAQVQGMQESAARSESISATAKAEVERLEKRLLTLESTNASLSADSASARATVEENTKDVEALRRQMQQARDLQEVRGKRVDEKLAFFDRLEATVAERVGKVERHLSKQLESMNQHTASTTEQLEVTLQDSFARFQAHVEKEIGRSMDEVQQRIQEDKQTEALQAAIAELQQSAQQTHEQLAALSTMQSSMARLEGHARRANAESVQQLQTLKADCEDAVRQVRLQVEGELHRLQRHLQAVEDKAAQGTQDCEDHAQRVTTQVQQLQSRVSALAETVASTLAAAATSAAVSAHTAPAQGSTTALAAFASSATSGGSTHLQGTTAFAPSKVSTLEGSGTAPAAASATVAQDSHDASLLPSASTPVNRAHPKQQPHQQLVQQEQHATPPSPPAAVGGAAGGGSGEAATHISSLSPVRASIGATAATSPGGSSLVRALEPGARPTPTTTSTSRSRSQGEEEGSQPSSSAGRPPPVPTGSKGAKTPLAQMQAPEPKRLPPPTTLPPSADTTLLGGGSTLGQRTMISRFIPVDDDATATSTQSEAVTPIPSRQHPARTTTTEERTDDVSTSLTTSPSETPAPATAMRRPSVGQGPKQEGPRPSAQAEAWASPSEPRALSTSTANAEDTASGTIEKQQQPLAPTEAEPTAVERQRPRSASREQGGRQAAGPSLDPTDPPQASTHRFDDWDDDAEDDDEEVEDEEEEDPVMALPVSDEDAVLPMDADAATPKQTPRAANEDLSSPEPTGPHAAALLRATPRKDFVGGDGDNDEDPLEKEEVPRHGQSTTSPSTTGGSSGSASAARASSRGSQEGGAPAVSARPAPAAKKYAYFDDSSSDEDDDDS